MNPKPILVTFFGVVAALASVSSSASAICLDDRRSSRQPGLLVSEHPR